MFNNLDKEIKKTMEEIANMMRSDIMRQVPQPGQNPYATGALKRNVKVFTNKNRDGDIDIIISYPTYGGYTNYGTRDESNRNNELAKPYFIRDAFAGYSKGGIRGIKPQNWLSLSQERQRYETFIDEEIGEDVRVFIEKYVNQLGIRTR
tara:strand:+ start:59 stop:505 length:447 start_codon:yes stop_codon:yes gene_type:complete